MLCLQHHEILQSWGRVAAYRTGAVHDLVNIRAAISEQRALGVTTYIYEFAPDHCLCYDITLEEAATHPVKSHSGLVV